MKKLIHILFIPYLILSFSLIPVTKGYAFTIGEEKEVGEKLLYTVRSNFELLDDPDIKQYVEKLGKEVIGVAGVQFFDYHFFVIKDKEFNAFAAPSGLIFFHSGLIEKMESESEFISVLAHEIGHIVKRHISSRISTGKKLSIATMGVLLASLALGGGAASEALVAGSLAAGQTANLHFSRANEEEADLLAYDWMKKLDRNPKGQVKMLKKMRQIARYRSSKIPQYLLTHPNPEARLDYVQTLIDTSPPNDTKFDEENNFNFLRFKYRIMAQTKESLQLRGYLSSIISSKKSKKFDVIMAKYGLAQLDRVENNFDESLKTINEIMATLGENNTLLVDKGVVEIESGKNSVAYETLSKAYNNDRNNMYAAFSLAKASFNLGKLDKAENLYKTVMYEIPEYSKAYFELGRLSSARNQPAETHYYLGKFHLLEGKLKLSRQSLKQAIKNPDLKTELEVDAKRSIDLIDRLEKK